MVYIKRKSCCITTPSPWAAKKGLMGGYFCFNMGFFVVSFFSFVGSTVAGFVECISAVQFLKVGVFLLYMILRMPTKKLLKKCKIHIPKLRKTYIATYSVQVVLFIVNLAMAILGTLNQEGKNGFDECSNITYDIGGVVAGVLFLVSIIMSLVLETVSMNKFMQKVKEENMIKNGGQNGGGYNGGHGHNKYYTNYNGAPGGNVVTNAQIYAGPNPNMPPGQYGNGYYQQPGMPYQQAQVPKSATADMGMGYNAGQPYNAEIQQYYANPAPQGVNVYAAPNIEPPTVQEPQVQAGVAVNVEPPSVKSETDIEIIEKNNS